MAKSRTKMVRIANDAARRATFKKRSTSLVKKVGELCTLCDVQGCLLIFCKPTECEPVFWPSVRHALRTVAHFKSLPELEQTRKMTDHDTFLQKKAMKLLERGHKLEREHRDLETMTLTISWLKVGRGLGHLSIEQATSLACMLEKDPMEIISKMARVVNELTDIRLDDEVAPPPATAAAGDESVAAGKRPAEPLDVRAAQREDQVAEMLGPWPEVGQSSAGPIGPCLGAFLR